MAGKIDQAALEAAIKQWEADTPKSAWALCGDGDKKDQFRLMINGSPDSEDKYVWLEDGKLRCSDAEDFGPAFYQKYLKPDPVDSLRKTTGSSRKPTSQAPKNMSSPGQTSSLAPVVPSGLGITTDDIIRYINPKATEAEAGMFLQWCQRKGFDPLKKQAYLVIYEGQKGRTVNHIVAVDTFAERAEKNGQFDGYQTGIIVKNAEGKIEKREGTFKLEEETLLGGWCDVYRKDRKFPYKIEVSLKEYDKKRSTWLEIPCTMINKVAICQAHRKAFPSDLGGCYDMSELGGIDPEKEISA